MNAAVPPPGTPCRRLPLPVVMFAAVSLLNEVSAQMVAPLIPILIASVLAAGPVAVGAVGGFADAVAAFLKLWSGRHADVRPRNFQFRQFNWPEVRAAGRSPEVNL